MTPNLPAPHVLKVIRFEPGRGIYEAGALQMEKFDVRAMTCDGASIEVSGEGEGFYEKYMFDISDPQNTPRITQHIHDSKLRFDPKKEGPAPDGNLGIPARGMTLLESSDAEHRYKLALSAHEVSGDCYTTYSKAELLQIDSHENVLQSVVLYEVVRQLCGE